MTERKVLRAHGWFNMITGKYSEWSPIDRNDSAWIRATIWSDDEPPPPSTKTVFQWRYRNAKGNWTVAKNLYTEAEANDWGVKHAGPFEVEL